MGKNTDQEIDRNRWKWIFLAFGTSWFFFVQNRIPLSKWSLTPQTHLNDAFRCGRAASTALVFSLYRSSTEQIIPNALTAELRGVLLLPPVFKNFFWKIFSLKIFVGCLGIWHLSRRFWDIKKSPLEQVCNFQGFPWTWVKNDFGWNFGCNLAIKSIEISKGWRGGVRLYPLKGWGLWLYGCLNSRKYSLTC